MIPESLQKLRRQFIVLGFAKGLLFWYAIEKLFETRIGITPAQIVIIGVIAQGSKVFFELPTSVFADRWDRRKVLIIAQLAMIASCLILGVSHSIAIYIVGTLFWSLSDALNSGVYEAFAYDTIAAAGFKSKFKQIYTRMNSSELVSIGLAGIIAGLLALQFNLRLSFFLSAVSASICLLFLFRLQEPPRNRTTDEQVGWGRHIGGAFKIIASPQIRWVAIIYIIFIGFMSIWYEYYQLLGLDVRLSPFLFGSLISIMTLGMTVGSELAHRLAATKRTLVAAWVVLFVTHLVCLRFHSAIAVFAMLFITFLVFMMFELYLGLYLQDKLSSERRATVFSLLTTVSYAWFFVLAAVFGLIINHVGIRTTLTITSLPLLLVGAIDIFKAVPWATGKVSDEVAAVEEII
jgi:predicted MFS family arabinose efflux permease